MLFFCLVLWYWVQLLLGSLNHAPKISDIDECKQTPNICGGPDEVCTNTIGGFKCQTVTCPYRFSRVRDAVHQSEWAISLHRYHHHHHNHHGCHHLQHSQATTIIPIVGASISHWPKLQSLFSTKPHLIIISLSVYMYHLRIFLLQHSSRNNIRCQKLRSPCDMRDSQCLRAPLSYSVHFISLQASMLRTPANLFTMRGPESSNKFLKFNLKVISSVDQITGQDNVVNDQYFHLRQVVRWLDGWRVDCVVYVGDRWIWLRCWCTLVRSVRYPYSHPSTHLCVHPPLRLINRLFMRVSTLLTPAICQLI